MLQFSDYHELIRKGGISSTHDQSDDLFITCISYEERSIAVPEALADNYRSKVSIIIKSQKLTQNSELRLNQNIEIAYNKLMSLSQEVKLLDICMKNNVEQVLELRKMVMQIPQDIEIKYVSIDSTTFTRESLIILLSLLRDKYPEVVIRTFYTSPNEHGEWLSRGVKEIRTVMGFSGLSNPGLPTLLMVLSGFEQERALEIIEAHEPSRLLFGIGQPATNPGFLERNYQEQKLILSRSIVDRFDFPTNSISACVTKLEEVLAPYLKMYNIVIAPMNTKLSTIAVFLISEKYPEIQLTYAVPHEYNTESYSFGIGGIYIEIIPQI